MCSYRLESLDYTDGITVISIKYINAVTKFSYKNSFLITINKYRIVYQLSFLHTLLSLMSNFHNTIKCKDINDANIIEAF